jgi:UDP-N-acetylmuramoyl-tripeptide--D-alanyl-D-alanine ligase
MRSELVTTAAGIAVFNDAYNANPSSMVAALDALAHLDAARRVAVLGPMAELGAHAEVEHRRIGDRAAELGIQVIAVGTDAYGGEVVPDPDAALAVLGPLGPEDAVLVKASRRAGLERLAEALLA